MGFQALKLEHNVLQEAREKLGLTQQRVADKAQIQLRQYQKFESGERSLTSSSFDIARRVLDALELDLAGFARGDYALSNEEEGGAILREYFANAKNEDVAYTDAFLDKLCVFVGRLERCSKREAQERLFAVGGVPQNNVSAVVSYVIAGKGAEDTKSYAEAKKYELGGLLSILTEQEFFDILEGKATPPEPPKPDPSIVIVEATKPLENGLSIEALIEKKRAAYIASKRLVVVE